MDRGVLATMMLSLVDAQTSASDAIRGVCSQYAGDALVGDAAAMAIFTSDCPDSCCDGTRDPLWNSFIDGYECTLPLLKANGCCANQGCAELHDCMVENANEYASSEKCPIPVSDALSGACFPEWNAIVGNTGVEAIFDSDCPDSCCGGRDLWNSFRNGLPHQHPGDDCTLLPLKENGCCENQACSALIDCIVEKTYQSSPTCASYTPVRAIFRTSTQSSGTTGSCAPGLSSTAWPLMRAGESVWLGTNQGGGVARVHARARGIRLKYANA